MAQNANSKYIIFAKVVGRKEPQWYCKGNKAHENDVSNDQSLSHCRICGAKAPNAIATFQQQMVEKGAISSAN